MPPEQKGSPWEKPKRDPRDKSLEIDLILEGLRERSSIVEARDTTEVIKRKSTLLDAGIVPASGNMWGDFSSEVPPNLKENKELPTTPSYPVSASGASRSERSETEIGSYGGIGYRILNPGMNALLQVRLPPEATFLAESGAMVSMSENVKLKGKTAGGLLSAIVRKGFSREKFFFEEFRTEKGEGEILLAPSTMGDIAVLHVENDVFCVQKDGFLASTSGVNVDTKMQGITKGLFSGEGFFVIKISGEGLAFINAFGSIHAIDIPSGKAYMIDTKHLVAWQARMKYEVAPPAGIFSTLTAGEILVDKFYGPGRVYLQSRNPQAFSEWSAKMLKLNELGKNGSQNS